MTTLTSGNMGSGLLLLTVLVPAILGQEDWGYERRNGPRTWPNRFPGCSGNAQSPINLDAYGFYETIDSTSFEWEGLSNMPVSMNLFNNGETVILNGTWLPGERPSITLWPDDRTTILDSCHYHFGKTGSDGTEHTINNQKFDMEMHCVTRPPPGTGKSTPVLVYSQLFQIGAEDITPGIGFIAGNLDQVIQPQSRHAIWPFPLRELIALEPMPFYLYQGSLTTPPCTEPVQWVVAGIPWGIKYKHIQRFRNLKNKDGAQMAGNVRDTQPLNQREVYVDIS